MENYLEYNYKKYPKSNIQDFIKLIYQATFGTGHLIDSIAVGLSNLKEEIAKLTEVNFYENLYDYISCDYVRVNLRVYKLYNLNVNLLNESFVNTANLFVNNNKTFLNELLNLRYFLLKNEFNLDEIDEYILDFKGEILHIPHHSQVYTEEYSPAYRVIHQSYLSEELQYYQVRHFIDKFEKTRVRFFALEGRAASGKTTIASLLKREPDITIIPIDDFNDNSPNEFGINSLRIEKEIFFPAVINKPLKYHQYDSSSNTFKEITINNLNPNVIIEGIFSSNPSLENNYQGIIYLNINEESQYNRLIKKNKILFNKYITELLPKENTYFKKYNPFLKADIIV